MGARALDSARPLCDRTSVCSCQRPPNRNLIALGPPARCPLTNFVGWEGSPTQIDYRKKGTLILTSLLEDLGLCLLTGPRAVEQQARQMRTGYHWYGDPRYEFWPAREGPRWKMSSELATSVSEVGVELATSSSAEGGPLQMISLGPLAVATGRIWVLNSR